MTVQGNEELWSIVMPSGEVRKGTLDQLDEAFNAGHIHSKTPVLAPGATAWSTLGELAGLEDPAPPTAVTSPNSLRPVASDVFVEFDDRTMMAPRKSRAGLVIGAFIAIAAIGGGAYVATTKGGPAAEEPKAAAAAQTATATATATVTATAPKAPPPPEADDGKPKLSEDQKKALLDADKKLADKMKSKKKDRDTAAASAPRRAGPAHDPFAKGKGGKCGCNKGDPMCSCL